MAVVSEENGSEREGSTRQPIRSRPVAPT